MTDRKRKRKTVSPWLVTLGCWAMRLCQRTYRVEVQDAIGFLTPARPWPVIAVLWHNRVAILADFMPAEIRHGAVALASASRDGEVAARALRIFGFQVVRGSSSRGGYQALLELRRKLDERITVGLTVDGPRGPRYEVHPGAVLLAEWTGLPVVPVSLNAPCRWELKGWDRTQIPKPFSRVKVVVGEALRVPPDLSPEQREAECRRVRNALLAITVDDRSPS
jgi:lysophospholipid acyltransferase (LPLAT)-like uncharacterized protein